MKPYPQRSLTPNPSPGGEGSRCIVVMVVFKIEGNRNNINNYECVSPPVKRNARGSDIADCHVKHHRDRMPCAITKTWIAVRNDSPPRSRGGDPLVCFFSH